MPEHPDLLPSLDGINSLGQPDRRWNKVYTNAINDGAADVPVANIATVDDVGSARKTVPTPASFGDNGKILVARNGDWVIESYPAGNLPPVTVDDAGKVLQVGLDGQWQPATAMVLPPVDATMNGCVLRVVAGQLIPWKKADGNLDPGAVDVPVAPTEDNHVLVSQGNAWTTKKMTELTSIPSIGSDDLGKYLTVVPDSPSGWKLAYTRPPVVTADKAGCLPPLPGDAKQFFNGAGTWSAVTAGNSGHWRVGDYKLTVRNVEAGWLACDGKNIGRAGSGANYTGNIYRALYAILAGNAGVPDWEVAWNNNSVQVLPNREYYQIRYAPDSQAPTAIAVLTDAFAGNPSHFQLQLCRTLAFDATTMYFNSYPSPAGWYRLDGDAPEMLSGAGNNFAAAAGILFDLAGTSSITAGVYYYRVRQLVGPSGSPTQTGRWSYGGIVAVNN